MKKKGIEYIYVIFLFFLYFVACSADSSKSGTMSPNSPDGTQVESAKSVEEISLVDERDGQVYRTVKIGEQIWMAENLNYALEGSCEFDAATSLHCEFQNRKCGRLYSWFDAQNICPTGWHLPSIEEYQMLFRMINLQSQSGNLVGRFLKSAKEWNEGGNGNDSLGFSALPLGGCVSYSHDGCQPKSYSNYGTEAYFWSSDGGATTLHMWRGDEYEDVVENYFSNVALYYNNDDALFETRNDIEYMPLYYSVRCIRN